MIVGGTGNYGGYVARSLADDPKIQLIISGRRLSKAQIVADALGACNKAEAIAYDLTGAPEAMAKVRPGIVINAVGPYHDQTYAVVEAAITCGAHYCDLADTRDFVTGIVSLDDRARSAGVAVISGASSIPALTAAYCDSAVSEGMTIRSVRCGISGAQQSNQGAGTAAGALRYAGERFTRPEAGVMRAVTGWTGHRRVRIPGLGQRWFAHANAPDLDLFGARYPELQNQGFYAGHEIPALHFATGALARLRSLRLLPRLDYLAPPLVKVSQLFNSLGRGESCMFLHIEGEDPAGKTQVKRHFIIVRDGHGPYIPCIPVVHIAKQLSAGRVIEPGARPCLGLISLHQYRAELEKLHAEVIDQ